MRMIVCQGCWYFLSSLLFATQAGAAGSADISPFFTHSAQTQSQVSVELRTRYFEEALLQEIENFDGYSVSAEMVWPLGSQSQLRVILPFWTEGDADYRVVPAEFDLEGYGGAFEFPSLIYERQFLHAENMSDWNASYSLGFGWVIESLDVYIGDVLTDRYNHKGFKNIFGVLADRKVFNGDWKLINNVELELFWQTDDLNPSDDGNSFTFLNVDTALQRHNPGYWVNPAVELLYTESFSDYRNLSLAPELLFSFGDDWNAKLAAPYRLAGDGEQFSVGLSLLKRF
ncbi:MAG: hypothetical protein OEU44_09615 [Gammaproteobacteria bacterium]|nr:hypothetical protein [Gammaproteobacteria bacterium]